MTDSQFLYIYLRRHTSTKDITVVNK